MCFYILACDRNNSKSIQDWRQSKKVIQNSEKTQPEETILKNETVFETILEK